MNYYSFLVVYHKNTAQKYFNLNWRGLIMVFNVFYHAICLLEREARKWKNLALSSFRSLWYNPRGRNIFSMVVQ